MFESFFPRPKAFFLSASILGIFSILVWYFYGSDIGAAIGLPFPPDDAETIVGLKFFVTNNFLTFYLYFWVIFLAFALTWFKISPHRWQYWSILGAGLIIFLSFISVQAGVSINYWYRGFYDLITAVLNGTEETTPSTLYKMLGQFASIAFFSLSLAVMNLFFVRHYIFRWRTAMNEYYTQHWQQLRQIEGASQRVQEDTMKFAALAQPLADSFIDAIMTLIAFLPILAGLSQYVTMLPIIGEIPNALMWAAIVWPLMGTLVVVVFGINLPGLEFKNQRVEAAYRKELVLGEDDANRAEPPTLRALFANVRKNYFRLYFHYLYFDFARYIYLQADAIFFLFIMVPSIAATTVSYGIFVQASSAFGKVSSSFQYLYRSWPSMIELISVYKRLQAFEATIDGGNLPKIDRDYTQAQGS